MALNITELIKLFETGEMPEVKEVEEPKTTSLSIIEFENAAKKTVSSALTAPEEPTTPKIYKDLAKTIKMKGDVDVEYSAESIAKQLKDKSYPSKEVATPVDTALGAYATFGVALTKIPRAVAASVLQAMQGMEGALDEDWADRYVDDANMDIQEFAKEAYMRFGDKGFAGIKITDLAELPQNVGYSATSMMAGLAVGLPLAAVPIPAFRVAAWGAGTLASGAVAYRATTYQIMKQYLDIKEKESEIYNNRKLTKEERTNLYEGFDKLAHQYGMWEAVPEALSNLAFGKLLLTPLTKMVGKSIAGQIIGRLGALYGEEFLTETITQMGQAGVEVRAGIRAGKAPDWDSPTDWLNSFKEIAPQTFLLTTLMAGASTSIISTARAIKDIKKSLQKEIGKTHVHYEGFVKKLDEVKKKPEPGTQYGEEPPPVTDKKVILETTKDVSRMGELARDEQRINTEGIAQALKGVKLDVKDVCMLVSEKVSNELMRQGIHDFKVVEGYIKFPGVDKFQHTWVELRGGEIIDRALGQFSALDVSAVKYLSGNRKVHSPSGYTALMEKFPTAPEETALMLPGPPSKIVTAGKKPGVMRTKVQAEKAIKEERANVCIRSMKKSSKISADTDTKIKRDYKMLTKIIDGVSKGSQIYWAGNRLIENIAGILDRTMPYGANWWAITGKINDAKNTFLDGNYSRVTALQDMLENVYGRKHMVDAMLRRRPVGRFELTDADIMTVYQGTFDKGVMQHLKGTGFNNKEIQQCIDIVKGDLKMQAVLKFGSDRYSDDHAPLAKVYGEQTGKSLPKRPFFMHLVVEKKDAHFVEDNVAEQMMQRGQMGTHAYITKNITKARVRSSQPLGLDYISNYLKYINEAEFYKAYAQPVKNLQSLLDSKKYRAAVESHLNHASLQALDKYLKDVSGTKTAANLDTMDKVASFLRRHTGIVQIGLNVLSGFRQTLSWFNAMAEVGPYWMFRGLEDVMRDYKGSQELVFSRSKQIEHRAGMWERFIAEQKQKEKAAQIISGKVTPQKVFMFLSSMFDRITVLCAAVATYKKVINTGKLVQGERIPNDNLERYAILEMDRVSRKTQPYVDAKDLPGWHRGSTIALMFTMYQNMANKTVNYVDYDIIQKLKYGTTTPLKASEKLLFSIILPALILGMIKRGRFPTLKEAGLDILRFPAHGMFIIGSMVNTVIDDYGEWDTPVLAGPKAFAETWKAATRGKWVQAGRSGIETTAYALGVPYNQPYRTYKGLRALMNDETDDWKRLIWSDWALTH